MPGSLDNQQTKALSKAAADEIAEAAFDTIQSTSGVLMAFDVENGGPIILHSKDSAYSVDQTAGGGTVTTLADDDAVLAEVNTRLA